MELNVQEWKDFTVSRLFDIQLSKGDIKVEDTDEGNIRLVSSGETDNGIVAYIDKSGDGKAKMFSDNVITADMFCNAFYQDKQFYAVSHGRVNILLPKFDCNIQIGLFISTLINNERYKYSYGRALYSGVVSNMILRLPIQHNPDGTPVIDANKIYSDDGYIPDCQFMEDYIKSLHSKPITTKISGGVAPELKINEWEEFFVGRLFTMLNGKGITKEEIELNKGDLPAIQSGEENNGVLGKISESYCKVAKYTMTRKQCLTVARTGSAGFVSYQGEGCVVGDSAKILLLDENVANVYTYMFLHTMLTANRFKYDYGRKVTESKYLNDILKLPIQRDDKGNPIVDADKKYSDKGYVPDWQFMEDYIKSLSYSDRI